MRIFRELLPPAIFKLGKNMARLYRAPATQKPSHEICLNNRTLSLSDPATRAIYQLYFLEQKYRFPTESTSPAILDCGAHRGISVHFWKTFYPGARVIAFEPDPENFAELERNCGGMDSVTLHNAAVWSRTGVLSFSQVGGLGGHITKFAEKRRCKTIRVRSLRLREFLFEPIDMLKLDVEGAEMEVLLDCREVLSNVKNIFVEYHSFVGRPQQLGTLLSLLENSGFRLHAHSELPAKQPYIQRPIINCKDFRLNIFGVRTGAPPSQKSSRQNNLTVN